MTHHKAGFWIAAIILLAIMLAVLELNKNTLAGFLLLLAASVLFVFLHARADRGGLQLLCWLGWIALFVGILFLTWPPVKSIPAVEGKNPASSAIVTTQKGRVQGVVTSDGAVEVFAGIPYAQPPVGELRWREPVPAKSWPGTLICDHFMPMSMQPTNLPIYDSLARIIC